ncbi:hypothetical protein [Mycolicibacterium duvalii]|uniref:Secreted protein n=1 Tax=Mycolicibacterium duvalii TaxID=39688 RepID=A0A7I7JUY1_9MYCO|nr:hypothetical protein [Mycolicibacterium duvalii]MCV7370071.1 hypothetical protein [Mycolicibacterium duvalii]BBX15676.1 hypothetical protein MDUV_05360 [Mycolicibacterium duvalii]
MRTANGLGILAATAAMALASLAGAPVAQAEDWGVDISGTWDVYSDGEWARTNDVLIDEKSVRETWTVDVQCVSPIECSGTVQSSLGWTGTARLDDYWFIEHEVPNWMPCPNGTFATGYQKFIMWGFDMDLERRMTRFFDTMAGRNVTKSDSGACGVNKPKVIELPVKAQKIS